MTVTGLPGGIATLDDEDGLVELARLAATNAEALTRLVHKTTPTLRRICAALGDRDSADDLVQETYARAIKSLPSFRGDASPVRWLGTIARRVCAEEIARRQRTRRLTEQLHVSFRHSEPDGSVRVELDDAIARLRPERREAFVLTAMAGLSYADAAAVCGCPIGTIRSRVARARGDLVRALHTEEPAIGQAG